MSRRPLVSLEPQRDRWGRPIVQPVNAEGQAIGKPVGYTRCTTFVGALEDMYNLQKWEKRMVAIGLSQRPDLVLSALAHKDNKTQLNIICDEAKEYAGAHMAATDGTSMHKICESYDLTGEVPDILPPVPKAMLAAYIEATKDFTWTAIEHFCVQDALKVGGTPDRIGTIGTGRHKLTLVADIKTGGIDFGILKIAMQIAMYARSWLCDPADWQRKVHGASTERGVIIHLPVVKDPADARCELIEVDLLQGWQGVIQARRVREARALKYGDLAKPFSLGAEYELGVQIAACTTEAEIRLLWQANKAVWSAHLTKLAKAAIAKLPAA